MANARMISRDFFGSADLIDQPYWAQVLFAGMIVLADDAGVIRADPLYLRNACLSPNKHRRAPDLCRISVALSLFVARRMLDPCKLEDVSCYKITNFTKFQRLKRREGKRREEKDGSDDAITSQVVSQEVSGRNEVFEVYAFEFKLGRPYAGEAVARLKPTWVDVEAWRVARMKLEPRRFRWAIQQFRHPSEMEQYRKGLQEEIARDPSMGETAEDRRSAVMRKRTLDSIAESRAIRAEAYTPPPEFFTAMRDRAKQKTGDQ